ncbi:PQQ-dependent dehydrogenase, methanol/ethanol family [Sphingobium sp. SCG-1]|nr:PQQ-dependent dehydrogenase, methanol/ethanol family [Sphingobium sp. SCG-1]
MWISGLLLALSGCEAGSRSGSEAAAGDWPAYGRTADEQHYSPLDQINAETAPRLGLVWSHDLPVGMSATQPIEQSGVVYITTGHSDVTALDAKSGRRQWIWESNARQLAGDKLRQGYGARGLAYYEGRIFVGTHDGRLVALDAATGEPVWTAQTVAKGDNAYISGAPRAFDGKVIIGFGGADGGGVRGYVSCYDSRTGKLLWKFYIVPGNPATATDETTKAVSSSWRGQWWKSGGGGTAWNAIVYDPELKRFYIGTGNGYPYNQKLRSPGGGDNLYLSSIVAVDAETGKYVWHYQINPGEQWDYKATQDITLATLDIHGRPRKVLMQAPTNGFFYVLDRETGKLISAKPYTKVTWASKIDLITGRPVENPGARFEKGLFEMWPTIAGGHNWPPQSFSPKTKLVYIPTINRGMFIGDEGLDLTTQTRKGYPNNINVGMGITGNFEPSLAGQGSFLLAWDPITQKARWKVPMPGFWPAGTMVTGGNLVFQGQMDNKFRAYDAVSGNPVWSYDTRAPIVAAAISYSVEGRQYITVLTGNGGSSGGYHGVMEQQFKIDYRSQARRVLTFALDGKKALPPALAAPPKIRPVDPGYRANPALERQGAGYYALACGTCHGSGGAAAGTAPDLRISLATQSEETFLAIVREGVLMPQGMPRFQDMPENWVLAIRQYLRARGQALPPTTRSGDG